MNVISNLSLRAKMVLPIIIGMIILTSGNAYYFINTIKGNSEKDLNSIAERTVGILSHALEYSVSINNVKDSEYLVEWLMERPDIYSITIHDDNKVLLHKTRDVKIDDEFLHSFVQDIKLRTLDDSLVSVSDISLDQSNSKIKIKKIGFVEVVVSSKITNYEYTEWLFGAAFFSLSLLIISTSISLLTSHTISNTIKRIIKGINEMGDGNLSSRIQYSKKKATVELSEIAETFNIMADKVQHAESELVAAHALQKRFLSTMSHDLRSPLGIMLSMIELTIKNEKLDSLSRFHLKSGYAAGNQLKHLVEDVLDIGKLEADEESLNIVCVDILTEIEKIINVQKTSVKNNIHVSVSIEKSPDVTAVKADKQKVLRIVGNLFSNAIKFTHEGSISIKCDLQELQDFGPNKKMLTFEIRDTGIGIPEDSLNTIYQPFKQVGAETSVQYGGSGLGLSIVHEYVLLMGGNIAVESKIGLGTKFTLQIPLCVKTNIVNVIDDIPKKLNNVVEIIGQKKVDILVIDDNEDYIEILNSYLEKHLYNIVSCNNGADGLSAFKENRCDIVLLDCQMPIMSGFEVSRSLREFEEVNHIEKTPVLAITANNKFDINEKCLDAGMTSVLTKPFTGDQLIRTINSLCETKTKTKGIN